MQQCLLVWRVAYNTKQNKYDAAVLINIVSTANIQVAIYQFILPCALKFVHHIKMPSQEMILSFFIVIFAIPCRIRNVTLREINVYRIWKRKIS